MKEDKILRPDAKGRITLGALAENVSSYRVCLDEETNNIILIPYTEIPLSEQWLFSNKKALEKVRRGLKQSFEGKTVSRGSFSKYIQDN